MPVNNTSILDSTKKILGVSPEFDAFDLDIITHINTAIGTLRQLGVGPEQGFELTGREEKWEDLLGDNPELLPAKSLIYFKTRMAFDPPSTSFAIEAMEKQIAELESRLMIQVDPPLPVIVPDTEDPFTGTTLYLTGGTA